MSENALAVASVFGANRPKFWALDRNGRVIPSDIETVEDLLLNGKRELKTDVVRDLTVSTIFLCVDEDERRTDSPLLFETVVCPSIRFPREALLDYRYSDRERALNGHQVAVNFLRRRTTRELRSSNFDWGKLRCKVNGEIASVAPSPPAAEIPPAGFVRPIFGHF